MELPVQVNGKVRDKITVAADADEATILDAAESAEKREAVDRRQDDQEEAVRAEEAGEFCCGMREFARCPLKSKRR